MVKSLSQLSSPYTSLVKLWVNSFDLPIASGDLKDTAVARYLSKGISAPLDGVIRIGLCWPLCKVCKGPLLRLRNSAFPRGTFKLPLFGERKASFHCLTSSTASLKFAGGFDWTASALREPAIHACFKSLRADTRRFGSFWKHCIRKSRAA